MMGKLGLITFVQRILTVIIVGTLVTVGLIYVSAPREPHHHHAIYEDD
jgi:hypothetical protein